jgi:cyanophycin synthetase
MVARIGRQMGKTVGLTNTSGVYINDEQILQADASGPKSARMVLRDPTVDLAVLETARGGMLREGLAFDRCDVGVVLNVSADHLGLKGVDTLEDLAAVKSIVTEAVGRRGVSVLNGDDHLTLRMAKHAGGRIAYFTLEGGPEMSPFLQRHVAEGGLLVAREPSVRGGDLVIHDRGERTFVIHGDEIPATMGGLAAFNIANALAAIAAGHALGAKHRTDRRRPARVQLESSGKPGPVQRPRRPWLPGDRRLRAQPRGHASDGRAGRGPAAER